jgi:hypothetical protein
VLHLVDAQHRATRPQLADAPHPARKPRLVAAQHPVDAQHRVRTCSPQHPDT